MSPWKYRKNLLVLWMALCCALALSLPALAQEALGENTGLTIRFQKEGMGFSGVEFQLYRVADWQGEGAFSLAGDFTQYPLSLECSPASQWRALAQTLAGYIARDDLEPLQTACTNGSGEVVFPGLAGGLYLALGDSCERQGTVYTPEAVLVSLPQGENETNPQGGVDVRCKVEETPSPEDLISLEVRKVWEDAGRETLRPQTIQVQLLKDGVVVDTVTLDASHSWAFQWDSLESGAHWQVVEDKVPEGYTVTVQREGNCFIIANHLGDQEPAAPENPEPPTSTTPSDPQLPQTGTLWWLAAALGGGGLLLLALGLALFGKKGGSHNG